jgi:hypothetical protein
MSAITLTKSLLLTLFLLIEFAPPIWAIAGDWTIDINTKLLDRVMRYPNSRLHPVIKASIYFKQPTRDEHVEPTIYEDIYYSRGRVIGLRRHNPLHIRSGTIGVIHVSGSSSDLRNDEACAAANAIVKLYLDLYLRKAALRFVVVSREFFDMVLQGLERYGFRPAFATPEQGVYALVMVHVTSDPPGRTQDLMY